MMERSLQTELLDELPADDPRAVGSRRDLRRINALMGNARHMARAVSAVTPQAAPRRIVDLGAGDGDFVLRWVHRIPSLAPGTEVLLVDRQDAADARVLTALNDRGFRTHQVSADGLAWLRSQPAQAGTWVLANLFLHHFPPERLRELLQAIAAKAELFCACEPRRGWWPLAASRMLRLIGANAVTRHDAVVSVRAGFQDGELSALWPADSGWRLQEQRAGLFSHLFLAQRV
ncbi:MAG: hypothetical protein ISQ14_09195 [Verrucomicrobiae bacterium]|jgi:hypothetical protein|nr:hypothetical protein [Verrucomicrobiae bacterium]